MVKNSASGRRGFDVRISGILSPHAKLIGDRGRATGAIRISDLFALHVLPKIQTVATFDFATESALSRRRHLRDCPLCARSGHSIIAHCANPSSCQLRKIGNNSAIARRFVSPQLNKMIRTFPDLIYAYGANCGVQVPRISSEMLNQQSCLRRYKSIHLSVD